MLCRAPASLCPCCAFVCAWHTIFIPTRFFFAMLFNMRLLVVGTAPGGGLRFRSLSPIHRHSSRQDIFKPADVSLDCLFRDGSGHAGHGTEPPPLAPRTPSSPSFTHFYVPPSRHGHYPLDMCFRQAPPDRERRRCSTSSAGARPNQPAGKRARSSWTACLGREAGQAAPT